MSEFWKEFEKAQAGLPTLNTSAVALHEMVLSYEKAGFTREEAIHIALAITIAVLKETRPDHDPPQS